MTTLTSIQPAKVDIIRMIESNTRLTNSTKAQYKKTISNYLDTGNSLADSEAIGRYPQTLSKSSKAFLKSAIRLWTERVALQAKGQSTPETVNAVTATLHRLDAINESIRVEQSKGQKAHTWLTQTEVKQWLNHCDDTITGKRDRVVLSLLLGAGLRRSELAALTFDSSKMQGDRTVLEVTGKGAKDRVIPVSDRLAQLLTEWQQIAGDGYIARSLGMNRELGDSLVRKFYETVINNQRYKSDLANKYQKRFLKYRSSLFTFLEHDGTPWNNNTAERAIRHIAKQRAISGSFHEAMMRHYLVLLSIRQTCRFQGKSFFRFLFSGETDLDKFEARKRKRHK